MAAAATTGKEHWQLVDSPILGGGCKRKGEVGVRRLARSKMQHHQLQKDAGCSSGKVDPVGSFQQGHCKSPPCWFLGWDDEELLSAPLLGRKAISSI